MAQAEIGASRQLLGELQRWVALETPTTEPLPVNAPMDVAAAGLAEAGVALTRIAGPAGYGDCLIARVNERSGVRPILVAAHLDTVWAAGTLETMPFRIDGERDDLGLFAPLAEDEEKSSGYRRSVGRCRSRKPHLTDAERAERMRELAREVGSDDDPAALGRALRKIAERRPEPVAAGAPKKRSSGQASA